MPTLLEAALVERLPDGGDAAVHHVGRRDEVGAGDGVRERGLHEVRDRDVVDDLLAVDDAAVAVRGVLAQADVGDHDQVAAPRASARARPTARAPSGSAARDPIDVLVRREAEQEHAGHAVGLRRRRLPSPPRPPTADTRPASS